MPEKQVTLTTVVGTIKLFWVGDLKKGNLPPYVLHVSYLLLLVTGVVILQQL